MVSEVEDGVRDSKYIEPLLQVIRAQKHKTKTTPDHGNCLGIGFQCLSPPVKFGK